MEDSPLKIEFLHQLNDLIKRDEENKIQITPINIKDIYNRFKTPTEQATIKDLHNEIKTLRQEIQTLKQNDISLEYRMLELKGREIIKSQTKTTQEEENMDQESYIKLLSLITTHK